MSGAEPRIETVGGDPVPLGQTGLSVQRLRSWKPTERRRSTSGDVPDWAFTPSNDTAAVLPAVDGRPGGVFVGNGNALLVGPTDVPLMNVTVALAFRMDRRLNNGTEPANLATILARRTATTEPGCTILRRDNGNTMRLFWVGTQGAWKWTDMYSRNPGSDLHVCVWKLAAVAGSGMVAHMVYRDANGRLDTHTETVTQTEHTVTVRTPVDTARPITLGGFRMPNGAAETSNCLVVLELAVYDELLTQEQMQTVYNEMENRYQ